MWPEFIEAGAKLCYEIQTYNDELLQAIGGRIKFDCGDILQFLKFIQVA